MMQTPFLDGIDGRIVQMTREGSAMKRLLTVEELAGVIAFLFSPASGYMSGANLNLTGGNVM